MKFKRISYGRAHDHHTLQAMRQQAAKAVSEGQTGQTVQSVATTFGVTQCSVFRWLADFASGGQNAFLVKAIPERPSKLSAEELSWIGNAVRDQNPKQFKFDFGLWALSLIRHLIKCEFNNDLSVSSVYRIMTTLGFSAQKLVYRAWQQHRVLVCTWETETYPVIRAEAKRVGTTIYFGDQSGIRSDYHSGTTWAPQGQTPVVQATGWHFSCDFGGYRAARDAFHAA